MGCAVGMEKKKHRANEAPEAYQVPVGPAGPLVWGSGDSMSFIKMRHGALGKYDDHPAQADMGSSYEIWRWKHVAQGDLGRTRKCPETRSRSS